MTKNLISEITACLSKLKDILCRAKSHKAVFDRDKKAEQEGLIKQEEINEFRRRIASGEQQQVSIQRLKELFPEERTYNQMFRQCTKCGVEVFDASNPAQLQSALDDTERESVLRNIGT